MCPVNTAERLSAEESDVSLRSWWRPKTELNKRRKKQGVSLYTWEHSCLIINQINDYTQCLHISKRWLKTRYELSVPRGHSVETKHNRTNRTNMSAVWDHFTVKQPLESFCVTQFYSRSIWSRSPTSFLALRLFSGKTDGHGDRMSITVGWWSPLGLNIVGKQNKVHKSSYF